MSVRIPPPPGRDSPRRRAARADLAAVLWDRRGHRRLPRQRELAAAMQACGDDVWWVCEANSYGPLYLLPTREWVQALSGWLDRLGARKVLEIGAGDGFLAAALRRANPARDMLAVDNGAWRRPAARMNAADRRRYRGIEFAGIPVADHVVRGGVDAIGRFRPDLTLVSWAPPGLLVERAIRAPRARLVLDIGVEGDVCGNGERTWRFNKDFLDGPLEDKALCRLDARPLSEARRSRLTLYYGRAHPEFSVTSRNRD